MSNSTDNRTLNKKMSMFLIVTILLSVVFNLLSPAIVLAEPIPFDITKVDTSSNPVTLSPIGSSCSSTTDLDVSNYSDFINGLDNFDSQGLDFTRSDFVTNFTNANTSIIGLSTDNVALKFFYSSQAPTLIYNGTDTTSTLDADFDSSTSYLLNTYCYNSQTYGTVYKLEYPTFSNSYSDYNYYTQLLSIDSANNSNLINSTLLKLVYTNNPLSVSGYSGTISLNPFKTPPENPLIKAEVTGRTVKITASIDSLTGQEAYLFQLSNPEYTDYDDCIADNGDCYIEITNTSGYITYSEVTLASNPSKNITGGTYTRSTLNYTLNFSTDDDYDITFIGWITDGIAYDTITVKTGTLSTVSNDVDQTSGVTCGIADFGCWISQGFNNLINSISSFFNNLFSYLGNLFTNLMDWAYNTFVGDVGSAFSDLSSAISTKLGFLWFPFTFIGDLFGSFTTGLTNPDCTLSFGTILGGHAVNFNLCQFEDNVPTLFSFFQTVIVAVTLFTLSFAFVNTVKELLTDD